MSVQMIIMQIEDDSDFGFEGGAALELKRGQFDDQYFARFGNRRQSRVNVAARHRVQPCPLQNMREPQRGRAFTRRAGDANDGRVDGAVDPLDFADGLEPPLAQSQQIGLVVRNAGRGDADVCFNVERCCCETAAQSLYVRYLVSFRTSVISDNLVTLPYQQLAHRDAAATQTVNEHFHAAPRSATAPATQAAVTSQKRVVTCVSDQPSSSK